MPCLEWPPWSNNAEPIWQCLQWCMFPDRFAIFLIPSDKHDNFGTIGLSSPALSDLPDNSVLSATSKTYTEVFLFMLCSSPLNVGSCSTCSSFPSSHAVKISPPSIATSPLWSCELDALLLSANHSLVMLSLHLRLHCPLHNPPPPRFPTSSQKVIHLPTLSPTPPVSRLV